ISATHVGVGAREQDLLDAAWLLTLFLPEEGAEGRASVVDGEGMARLLDARAEGQVRELEAVDRGVDDVGQVERQADGIHGVPDTEKGDWNITVQRVIAFERIRGDARGGSGPMLHDKDPVVSAIRSVGLADRLSQGAGG